MSDDAALDLVDSVEESTVEGSTRASWEGSDVGRAEIDWLVRTRRIPAGVECRVPGTETAPSLRKGEYVVFIAHFERGFGLPASAFFRNFLRNFGLQPHHLPANAITTLSAFVAFTEGYLGLKPTVRAWSKYFGFRKQVIPNPERPNAPKEMTQCGAATVTPRRSSIFPRINGLESCRKWQRSFFYVKNSTDVDLINLPDFVIGPPTAQLNWGYNPTDTVTEVNQIHRVVAQLGKEGMTADDLLATFISRRVSPLQRRVHKICHMSGPLDPTRTSTFELDKAKIRRRVKAIARTKMPEEWEWGKEPHSRSNLPPQVNDLNRHMLSTDVNFYVGSAFYTWPQPFFASII